jgi:hypothetical protein
VAEEDIGNDMWGVALDDLVQHIRAVGHGVGPVPAAENVAHDPDALAGILGFLELLDEKAEHAREVGISCVQERVHVVVVIQIGIERDDAETQRMYDRVGGVVERCLGLSSRINPAIVLPQFGNVVVVPRELLAQRPVVINGVRSIQVVRASVVVLETVQFNAVRDLRGGIM